MITCAQTHVDTFDIVLHSVQIRLHFSVYRWIQRWFREPILETPSPEAVEAVAMFIAQWFFKQVFFEYCRGLLNNVIPRRAVVNTLMWSGQTPLELIWSALISLDPQKLSIQKLSANAMLHHVDVLPNPQDICLKYALIRCWWNPRSWRYDPATCFK